MTQIEINEQAEKQAEEYAYNSMREWHKYDEIYVNDAESKIEQGFIAGVKWGTEHAIEWHDLRKNPEDLPKYENSMTIRICWINPYGNKCYRDAFYDKKGFYWVSEKTCRKIYTDEVIAWCESPQFKE